MKKIFTLCSTMLLSLVLSATTTSIWKGTQVLGPEGNDALTLTATDVAALVLNDQIAVTIADMTESYCQLNIAGTNPWTVVPGTNWADITEAGTHTYAIADEALLNSILSGGMMIQGKLCTLTEVAIVHEGSDPDPDPDPEVPDTLQPGETKVLWEGEETLSWNEVAEQDSLVGALLGEKDQIIVTVSAKGTAEWPKVLLRDTTSTQVGNDILLNEVTEFPYEAVFTLTAIDVETLKGGFKLCGDGVTVTKMVLKKYKEEPGPEPQPQDTIPYVFSNVWTGDKAISWNTEVYAGEQFDTYALQQDMFAGLAKDDSIKVFYAEAIEGAQFAASYKAGEEWTWTDLAITEHEGFYAYRVATEEMAEVIADRGIVLRGQGYHATRIEIGKPKNEPQGIESIQSSEISSQKIFRNGQILIIREDGIYSILGQKIQ